MKPSSTVSSQKQGHAAHCLSDLSAERAVELSGAMALLRDCVGGHKGERLLLVCEPDDVNYYDHDAAGLTAAAGRALGMMVYETVSDSLIRDDKDRASLVNTLAGFDHIIFFSRVGDQIRFCNELAIPSATMCYTLNPETLNSAFGTACYGGMQEIKHAIDRAFAEATDIRVTCPRGTDFGGRAQFVQGTTDVHIKRFPLLVPTPIPTAGLKGVVALSRFLTGTGSRIYEPYSLELNVDVLATFENNKILSFEGDASEVARIEAHYQSVSRQLDIQPWFVDSWHPGIHPGCSSGVKAQDDIVRWSGTAFGNPRVLHFHTCGDYPPGEICWHVLDPTIRIDDVPVWENGRLYPQRLQDGEAILARHPDLAWLFDHPSQAIGL